MSACLFFLCRSFHRVYQNSVDTTGKAPYYITIGDGGNREGLASNWYSPQPAISAFRQASYGHGELKVVNATHMFWEWHQNPDLEPTVADSLWIVKGKSSELEGLGEESASEFRFRTGVKRSSSKRSKSAFKGGRKAVAEEEEMAEEGEISIPRGVTGQPLFRNKKAAEAIKARNRELKNNNNRRAL